MCQLLAHPIEGQCSSRIYCCWPIYPITDKISIPYDPIFIEFACTGTVSKTRCEFLSAFSTNRCIMFSRFIPRDFLLMYKRARCVGTQPSTYYLIVFCIASPPMHSLTARCCPIRPLSYVSSSSTCRICIIAPLSPLRGKFFHQAQKSTQSSERPSQ